MYVCLSVNSSRHPPHPTPPLHVFFVFFDSTSHLEPRHQRGNYYHITSTVTTTDYNYITMSVTTTSLQQLLGQLPPHCYNNYHHGLLHYYDNYYDSYHHITMTITLTVTTTPLQQLPPWITTTLL